jgi:hypothetical protein
MVAADGIDILVDLAGHTAHNRLGVFARRRAPVQVTWLGYPATTGLPAIDHRIVDAITDPPGAEALSVERLARLPGCFLCYEPPATSVQPGPLPAPVRGRVTFGSFNNVSKINGATVALWAGVLAAVPGARLLLKSRTTRDEATRARLLTLFEARGIAPARIDFLPWQPDLKRHIEIYRQVEQVEEVLESIAIGQDWEGDVRVVLFVKLRPGTTLDEALERRIRDQIRRNTTPRHVPARIVQIADIPRTKSGKITELAVRDVVHGRTVRNKEALANPEALDLYRDLPLLAR